MSPALLSKQPPAQPPPQRQAPLLHTRSTCQTRSTLSTLHYTLTPFPQVRVRSTEGSYVLSHVDAVVDEMLRKDYMFDIALPHIPNR